MKIFVALFIFPALAFATVQRTLQEHILTVTGSNDVAVGTNVMPSLTTGSENVGVGANALSDLTSGNYNTAVGSNAGAASTTINYNTAVGFNALNANTTSGQTAVGYLAGAFNTTGQIAAVGYMAGANNTTGIVAALGYGAAQSNTTGLVAAFGSGAAQSATSGFVTALGHSAANSDTTGNITAVGLQAGYYNTIGNLTAIGYAAALNNTTGTQNTVLGYQALYANTNGNNNIAVGYNSGNHITTGSNNVIVGATSGTNIIDSSTNNILLGAFADVPTSEASDTLDIGNAIYATGLSRNTGVIGTPLVGIGNSDPNYLLHVGDTSTTSGPVAAFTSTAGTCTITPSSSSASLACSSDERLKENIMDISGEEILKRMSTLQAVTYTLKNENNGRRHTGFIAQNVAIVSPEFVSKGKDGFLKVAYDGFIPWLAEGMKTLNIHLANIEQQIERDKIQTRMTNLELENTELKNRLSKIEEKLNH